MKGKNSNAGNQQRKNKPVNKSKAVYKNKESPQEYADVICYSCGEPGHHKTQCQQAPACFICKMVNHKVEECSVRKKPRNTTKFMGSVATGLGFFQIEVPDVNDQHLGTGKNVGIVYIEAGQVTKEELAHNFSLIYKTNWPWQVRKLDNWTYLVKFPPHIPVAQVAGYPNFGLPEMEGVIVNVEEWKGELEHLAELQTVWLQLTGVAPKWAEWSVLEQFISVVGTLVDVDWQGNFKSFFEVVRVQIRCKDYTKIPTSRVFGIGKKLHKIGITVEPPVEELSDDLLDDITEKDDDTVANKDTSAAGGASNNGGSVSKSNSAGTNMTKGNNSSSQYTKQAATTFMQSMLDSGVDEHSCQLLQAMELEDEEDEEIYKNLIEESGEITNDGDEVLFSPSQDITEQVVDTQKDATNKWGPVQAQRKSARVDVGGKTMLEIAVNKKKIQNLEKEKETYKDPSNSQEVDDPFQGLPSGKSETCLAEDSVNTHFPFPADNGVTEGMDTEGVLSQGALTEMSLGMGGEGSGKLSQGRCSPPRSPGRNFKTMPALSPITPLELPLSPIQAIKRIKSSEYHKAMELEALMNSNGMMLGV